MKTKIFNKHYILFLICISLVFNVVAKVKPLGKSVLLRPINIKNVAFAPDGRSFTVPNIITAGSVAIFFVSEKGETGPVPSRFSEKDFVHAAGVFYYYHSKNELPSLAFLPLQELLTGYTVSYMPDRKILAAAGGDRVYIYDSESWRQIKTITLGSNTTRAIFSPDRSLLGVISNGRLYMLETSTYSLLYTVSPEQGHQFADISFHSSSSKFALFEFRSTTYDHASRIRIYESKSGSLDRNLPYFEDKISNKIGSHFPLLSYSSADSAIAVTLEKSFNARVVLIKSNDGTQIREFKGSCHAFSGDGSLFAVGGKVYSTVDWKDLGSHSSSAVTIAFSPTERVILVITPESMRRYKIE